VKQVEGKSQQLIFRVCRGRKKGEESIHILPYLRQEGGLEKKI
jgi:hypothetical protein